jgi:hypothetical protein
VLQHLSNEEIGILLGKLHKYPYLLVTEHYPSPALASTENADKPHGGDTRIIDNSAVYLDRPPYNLANVEEFLTVDAGQYLVAAGETIKTWLVTN